MAIQHCLALMVKQRALASSLATSERCWDGAPSPVSRERGALGETGPGSGWMLALRLQNSPSGKLGREMPPSPSPRQLPGCRQARDHWSELAVGCFGRISGQGNYSGDMESREMFCSRLGRLLLCAGGFLPPLFWEGHRSPRNPSCRFRLPWVQSAPHGFCRSRNWDLGTLWVPLCLSSLSIPILTPPASALPQTEPAPPGRAAACLAPKGCEGQDFAESCFGSRLWEGRATRSLSGPSTAGFQAEQGGKSCLCSSPPFVAGDLVATWE